MTLNRTTDRTTGCSSQRARRQLFGANLHHHHQCEKRQSAAAASTASIVIGTVLATIQPARPGVRQ